MAASGKNKNKNRKQNAKNRLSFLQDDLPYLDAKSAQYILNLLDSVSPESPDALRLMHNFEHCFINVPGYPDELLIPVEEAGKKNAEAGERDPYERLKYTTGHKTRLDPKDWEIAKSYLRTLRDQALDVGEIRPPRELRNFQRLLVQLGFEKSIEELTEFLYVYQKQLDLNAFCNDLDIQPESVGRFCAVMLGDQKNADYFTKILDRSGTLSEYSLIDHQSATLNEKNVLPILYDFIFEQIDIEASNEELLEFITGKTLTSDLEIDDFSYLNPQLERLVKELARASESKEKGFSVLLVGSEGVGKTELAPVLAQHAGLSLLSVGESDKSTGNGSTGLRVVNTTKAETHELRMAELRRAQKIYSGRSDILLLMDEAEDLLPKGQDSGKTPDPANKVALNRLLEENEVPTVFACNDLEKFHPSFLDRFQVILHVDKQPTLIRKNVWLRQAQKQGVDLSDKDALYLAREYDIAPRKIVTALRSAARQDGGLKEVEARLRANALDKSAILANHALPPKFETDLYTLTGQERLSDGSSDKNIAALIEMANQNYPFSLFLKHGVGMEEDALLTYIAEQVKMNIDIYEASDLAEPHPMMPPQAKIEHVFSSAENRGRLAVVKNIDALAIPGDAEDMPDADICQRVWESSPLTRLFRDKAMNHKLPLVATCNEGKAEYISPIFRSIFSEHARLHDIEPERLGKIFSRFFGHNLPEGADKDGFQAFDIFSAARIMERRPDQKSASACYDAIAQQKHLRQEGFTMPDSKIGFRADIRQIRPG